MPADSQQWLMIAMFALAATHGLFSCAVLLLVSEPECDARVAFVRVTGMVDICVSIVVVTLLWICGFSSVRDEVATSVRAGHTIVIIATPCEV